MDVDSRVTQWDEGWGFYARRSLEVRALSKRTVQRRLGWFGQLNWKKEDRLLKIMTATGVCGGRGR